MDTAFRAVPSAIAHSTEPALPRPSPESNAHSQDSSWSRMFNSTSALNRPFSRLSRKGNSTPPSSIDFSTLHEPLEVLQSLLDTLRKSRVPGPQFIRLRDEFNFVIGYGAQCDVLGPSADSERLLRAAFLKEFDARTATALQTCKVVAVKRTRTFGNPLGTPTSQGPGSRGLRDQLISAQKDINALCHEPFRRHPNIVSLQGWGLCLDTLEDPSGESPSIPLLILERADLNLTEFLQSQSRWSHSERNYQELRKIGLDIGKGLDAIHKENITHGDLKPDNVLIFLSQSKCTAKICDFGLATAEKKGNEALAEYRGTPGWRPPESSRTLTSASLVLCDVFAYGLVVWCIATLDWRSPIGESEDLEEKELYYLAWRGVQEAKVMPTGDEMIRVLRVLRGSLHTQPRLRETSPWNYLDEKQFRVIASVYNPTQSSASLIVFDFLNQATEWASNRMNNLPQATDLGWFSRCPLQILAACFLVSETLSGRLHLLGGAVLGAAFKLVSLGMHTWMSRSVLDRQDVYGWCFAQYQTNLGNIISMDLDGIDPFAHPLHECLDIGDLRSSLRWQCLSLQRRDSDHLTQPGVVENRIYALARLRSRFCSCCWNKDGTSPNILMEALSCVDDIATLAWLCRGQIGQAELHDCPKEALWRSVYKPRCSQAHRIERMILLLEMGGHVEDQMSDTGAPTSAFGRILQALVDEERESSGLSMTAVKVCKHFRRIAANPKSSPQARFFMTGELPDQEDIDSNSGFSTTALHEAVLARCYDAVEYLLRIQFPVHVLNQQRQTPFQLAKALAQDSAEPHQKLQSLRILALMKQNVAEADDESALPIGWVAKELTSGRCVYNEIYTNSITFKMPKFSLFEDRRLALGFRKIKALGQTYFVDLIRFISWDIPEAQNEPLDRWTSYDEAWFKRDIRETKARVLETPTWLTNSYRVVFFIAWSVWCILTSSYLNVFLIFLPLSIIARLANWDCRVLMGLSCLALMSLGSILTFTMEQVSMRLGAFGKGVAIAASESMVEFLIGVIAVSFGEVEFVKAIVVGGIVNNICLVLGISFIAAGVRYHEVMFNPFAAFMMHQLLAIATIPLAIISSFHIGMQRSRGNDSGDIILLSFGSSVVMIILYALDLFFRYRTHGQLYDKEDENYLDDEDGKRLYQDVQAPQINTFVACSAALISVTMMTVCAILLVESTSKSQPPLALPIGMFVVPIGLKSGVHLRAIRHAQTNQMDRALDSVIRSTLRTMLLLTPVFFFLGWANGLPFVMVFDQVQVVTVGLVVMMMSPVMRSGKSTFLSGVQLLVMYILFCLLYYSYIRIKSE